VVSPFHSIAACIISILGMFFVCEEGNNVFNDEECINTPRYIHVWSLMHTCGFFFVDAFWLATMTGETVTAYDVQMYCHHFVSIFVWYSTLYFMNFSVVLGTMILFVEISTVFIAFRWLLYTHGYQHTVTAQLNTVFSFFSFLCGRFIYMWWLLYEFCYPLLWHQVST
jgi:hypothetical protein